MGSFTENIDVDFDIQPKKKKKKDTGKVSKDSKTQWEQRRSIFLPKTIMLKRDIYVTRIL